MAMSKELEVKAWKRGGVIAREYDPNDPMIKPRPNDLKEVVSDTQKSIDLAIMAMQSDQSITKSMQEVALSELAESLRVAQATIADMQSQLTLQAEAIKTLADKTGCKIPALNNK